MTYEMPKLIRDDARNAHTFIMGKRMDIICHKDFWTEGGYFIEYFGKLDNGLLIQFYTDAENNIHWEFETEDIYKLFTFLGIKVKAKFEEGECDDCGFYEVTDFYLPSGKNLYYESHFGNSNMPQGWDEFLEIAEEELEYRDY